MTECGVTRPLHHSHLHRRHTFASSRRVSPELCGNASPPLKEGAGKTGSRLAPIVRYAMSSLRYNAQRVTGQPEHPGLPCAVVGTAYVVLSPGSDALLPPSPLRMADAHTRSGCHITARTWRTDPGRQDDTIWPYADHICRWREVFAHGRPPCEAFRADVTCVHRRPARVRDDRDTSLFLGPGCGDRYAVSEFR
ncbi:hypothetical protein ABIF90_009596 [Bradyrhizobium japonicum]